MTMAIAQSIQDINQKKVLAFQTPINLAKKVLTGAQNQ